MNTAYHKNGYVYQNKAGEYLIYSRRTAHTGTHETIGFTQNLSMATINPDVTHKLISKHSLTRVEVKLTVQPR